jgi:hypothetical protein
MMRPPPVALMSPSYAAYRPPPVPVQAPVPYYQPPPVQAAPYNYDEG